MICNIHTVCSHGAITAIGLAYAIARNYNYFLLVRLSTILMLTSMPTFSTVRPPSRPEDSSSAGLFRLARLSANRGVHDPSTKWRTLLVRPCGVHILRRSTPVITYAQKPMYSLCSCVYIICNRSASCFDLLWPRAEHVHWFVHRHF